MEPRIGKTVRQYIAERSARDPEFATALQEARAQSEPLFSAPREELAEYAHAAWSGWMRYMLGKCSPFIDERDGTVLGLVIPQPLVERWERQMTTSYDGLPEAEKESDRTEADKMLAIFAATYEPVEG